MLELDIAASMGLQNLQYEPQRLLSESERLNSELESLVMDNYRIFVENLTCSVHLRSEDKKLGECAGELGEKLSSLQKQCAAFRDRVNQFVNSHKRNRKTLQHHMQLVELLEVPQLVDACARNGFHEEALELANFVNGLERRHLLAAEVRSIDGKARGGSGVVQSIVDDVHTTLLSLRQQLLHLLTEQASLPKELQILSTLRKLDGLLIDRQLALERHDNEALARMSDKKRERLRQHLLQCSETRLQMDFLEARTVWLERVAERALHGLSGESINMLASIEGVDEKRNANQTSNGTLGPYGRALEMLEVNRTTWFSVVTQFKALFEENSDVELCSHPPTAILGAWATGQVHQLLHNLQQLIPSIDDGASLRGVLEQTCFFANRMGQVGCDLSSLAMPLFRQALITRLTGDWKTATAHLKSMLATERFVVEIDDITREQVIPLYLRQDQPFGDDPGSSPALSKRINDDVPAPANIMAYPPLAYFLNSILNGLNFLRECPMLSAKDALLGELVAVLIDSCSFFVGLSSDISVRGAKYLPQGGGAPNKNSKTGMGNGNSNGNGIGSDKEKSNIVLSMDKQYAIILAQELIPHVLLCFEHVFMDQLPQQTSTTTSKLFIDTIEVVEKGSKNKGKNVSLKILTLSSARGCMSQISFAALSTCWNMLRTSDLIPTEKVSIPIPIQSVPITKLTTISPHQNEIELEVEVEIESKIPIDNQNFSTEISIESPSDLIISTDEKDNNVDNNDIVSDVIFEDIYKNAADDIHGNATIIRSKVLKNKENISK